MKYSILLEYTFMAFTGVFNGLLYNSKVFVGHEYGNFHTIFMTQISAFFIGLNP